MMYLIVGLGNPGSKYDGTRHNVGFRVADRLAGRWGISIDKKRFEGRTGGGSIQDLPVLILKPETFMNLSGVAVRAAMDFYKLEPKDLVVIMDDLALPVGQIRIRPQGSGGGHNGMADVISRVGTNQVGRVRVGIGAPPPMMDAVEYVLGHFRTEEKTVMDPAIDQAADAVERILAEGYLKAMERFNRAPSPEGLKEK
jgi:peptidyl-tRNA hydrolase, PTH1 family